MKKRMKMLAAILAAGMISVTMAAPVFADEEAPAGEEQAASLSITVTNAVAGRTYDVYQIFTEASKADDQHISWQVVAAWQNFVKDYVTLDKNGYVEASTIPANDQTFTQAALVYAKANSIAPVASGTASGTSLEIAVTDPAYYLVSSTGGAFVSVGTIDGDHATIAEKNGTPSVEKEVKEKTEWGASNTVSIGDTVEYRTTITVEAGAKGYVLHDMMDAGLDFASVSSVKIGTEDVAAANYTVKTTGFAAGDTCDFEIAFSDAYIATLTPGTEIVVSYTATVNKNAVINGDNKNVTNLSYNNNTTVNSETVTKTYEIGANSTLKKTDSKGAPLAGVKFTLQNTAGKYITIDADNKFNGLSDNKVELVTDANGCIDVKGLDADSYVLTETEALAGYNLLTDYVDITIAEDGTVSYKYHEASDESAGNSIEIVNKNGSLLPSTGGMGTTIFYVVGGILIAGAAVVLITKKRAKAE